MGGAPLRTRLQRGIMRCEVIFVVYILQHDYRIPYGVIFDIRAILYSDTTNDFNTTFKIQLERCPKSF